MSVGTLWKFVLQPVDSRHLTDWGVRQVFGVLCMLVMDGDEDCPLGEKMIYNIYTEITNMFYLLWFSFDLRFTAYIPWTVLNRVDVVPPVHHMVPAVRSVAWTQMIYRKKWKSDHSSSVLSYCCIII